MDFWRLLFQKSDGIEILKLELVCKDFLRIGREERAWRDRNPESSLERCNRQENNFCYRTTKCSGVIMDDISEGALDRLYRTGRTFRDEELDLDRVKCTFWAKAYNKRSHCLTCITYCDELSEKLFKESDRRWSIIVAKDKEIKRRQDKNKK